MSIATPRGRLVALAILVAAGLAVAVTFAWCSRTPAEVRANEALLAAVPRYPGAVEVERHSTPYNFADGVSLISPATGWNTTVTYRAPVGTTPSDIWGFYEGALGEDWQRRVATTPIVRLDGSMPALGGGASPTPRATAEVVGEHQSLYFCRGEARLGVGVDNLEQLGVFEIGVDVSWAEAGIRGC